MSNTLNYGYTEADVAHSMSGKLGWRFPPQNGGVEQGFNDPAIDHFKGERVSALVRETIQNALDARAHASEPVVVAFTLDTLTDLDSTGFLDLRRYFKEGLRIEELHKHENNVAFYRRALEQVDDGVVRLLGVHDYNTRGLTGPTENPPGEPAVGAWLALVKGAGITHKASAGALGSFGHGSRAPFAMSELRTVFYLSRIDEGDGIETRFQGKSILQSVPLNGITQENQWSQSTGYYGWYEQDVCRALIGDQVPGWATRFRRDHAGVNGLGTSVFIPEPYEVSDERQFWAQIRLAVIANFYYAILAGHLVVLLGDDIRIDAETAEDVFEEVQADLKSLNPNDNVLERLKSALTVHLEKNPGERELAGVGKVKFYFRFAEVTEKRVGIARGNGMLITRRPEMLQRFDGPLKPFDLFLCVVDEDGSALLRSLENPAHDAFDFDRIDNKEKRAEARARYADFAKSVRALVKEYASIEMQDEEIIAELDEFFRPETGSGPDSREGERGRGLKIDRVGKRKPRSTGGGAGGAGDDGEGGGGATGGGGKKETAGGNIPGRGSAPTKTKRGTPVRNLRIVRDPNSSRGATVSFTAPETGDGHLVLLRSGEKNTERLKFRMDGAEWVTELPVEGLTLNERRHIRVEFHDPSNLEFAIEGRLAE